MNRFDRDFIISMVGTKKITNMCINSATSLVAICKRNKFTGYATMENFTKYKLYQLMKEKMPYVFRSSVSRSVDLLEELGLIKIVTYTNDKGVEQTDLILLGNYDGFIASSEDYKSNGYIKLHHCFFKPVFYKLSLRAKKLALVIFSRLDNDSSKKEKFNFKSKKNPQTFIDYCELLCVNRLSHITNAIKELEGLFNVTKLANNTYEFSLKGVSKAIVNDNERLYSFTQKQLAKVKTMIDRGNKNNLKFRDAHIKDMCEVLKSYNMNFAQLIVNEICLNDRSHIQRMKAYVKQIIKRVETETCF